MNENRGSHIGTVRVFLYALAARRPWEAGRVAVRPAQDAFWRKGSRQQTDLPVVSGGAGMQPFRRNLFDRVGRGGVTTLG